MAISDKQAQELNIVATTIALIPAIALTVIGVGILWFWKANAGTPGPDSPPQYRTNFFMLSIGCVWITWGIHWGRRAITNNFSDDEV
jgi:heme/copper-type cytochrome/quinol oxidase subunit 2